MDPRCDRCSKPLTELDMSRGTLTFGGSLPTLYQGVVCNACQKVECTDCKGGLLDSPCSWCGGEVSPAYKNLL